MSCTHLALFDLDHTLLDGDSNSLWVDFLVERGRLPTEARAQQARYLTRYRAEKLDILDYLGFHLRLLSSWPLAEWQPVLDEFVARRVAPRIGLAARNAVAAHRAAGHRVLMVTATHEFLAGAIGRSLELPVIASRGEVRDGYLTGRIEGTPCFREAKLSCLAEWLEREGLATAAIGKRYFYSDSANDLPLLTAVSHPVAVNPDSRLAAVAAERGWPIFDWRSVAETC